MRTQAINLCGSIMAEARAHRLSIRKVLSRSQRVSVKFATRLNDESTTKAFQCSPQWSCM